MNILVDTSVWSLALRRKGHGSPSPLVAVLADLVQGGGALIMGPIRQSSFPASALPTRSTRSGSICAPFPTSSWVPATMRRLLRFPTAAARPVFRVRVSISSFVRSPPVERSRSLRATRTSSTTPGSCHWLCILKAAIVGRNSGLSGIAPGIILEARRLNSGEAPRSGDFPWNRLLVDLLEGLPLVSYPTSRVSAIRITVSPMDNATFRVPLVLATE